MNPVAINVAISVPIILTSLQLRLSDELRFGWGYELGESEASSCLYFGVLYNEL